jgi:hypothetical protein
VRRLVAACAVLAVASCDDVTVHILTAQPYQPPGSGQTLGCLQSTGAVDVVNGSATADDCDLTCIVSTSGGAQSTYLTTVCGPYPGYSAETQDQVDGAADPCNGAFAAYAADAQCAPSDGGDAEASTGDDGGGGGGGGEAGGDDGGDTANGDGGGPDATGE